MFVLYHCGLISHLRPAMFLLLDWLVSDMLEKLLQEGTLSPRDKPVGVACACTTPQLKQQGFVFPWAELEGLQDKGRRWVVCFSLQELRAGLQSQEIDFDLLVSVSCHSSGMCA